MDFVLYLSKKEIVLVKGLKNGRKKVEIKYHNFGYFKKGELEEIRGILENELDDLKARKASGFWVVVEGTLKEEGLPKILEELKERHKGEITIGFSGYSQKEIVNLLNETPYELNIEARKYLG